MKLPLNKKIIMLPGVGIAVFGISVMGMIFMRDSKSPPEQVIQAAFPDVKEDDGTTLNQFGTSTAGITKTARDKKEKIPTKLPSVYKQNATTIFKPLSSSEISAMLKEMEKEKNEYRKRNELLDFKERVLESVRADLEAERKELDAIKQELNKIFEIVSKQKGELKKETILLNEVESKNIKKLAAVYSGMKPEKAALIIKEMDEETAVKLLTTMDGKTSARILESIDPNLAVKLSERLKLLKSDFKNEKK
jgi:flagellar motility protein MotE (MotC chaperone)